MGVHQELVNFDELFHHYLHNEPVIVNDVVESSEEDKETFNKLIYTKYGTDIDLLNNLPSCNCKKLTGMPNIDRLCTNCNTVVKSSVDQKLEPLVWIRAPEGVAPLINPAVWTLLSEEFTISGFNIIAWFCDTRYDPPAIKVPKVMDKVRAFNFERGYNNFVANFDAIISALFELREFKPKRVAGQPPDFIQEQELRILLRQSRDCIFSKYLPIPNRSLLVLEETNLGNYIDPIVPVVVDAIRTLVGIDTKPLSAKATTEAEERRYRATVRTKENRTVKTISCLANFYDDFYSTVIAKKEGILRKHVYATRCNWSGRAVIRSITDVHHYRELHIPWSIGVTMLRYHLINKLYKLDYGPNEAFALLNAYSERYHPLLDKLFNELIAESPGMGIPCVLQRNPSLERGSAQSVFITKVRTDVKVPTISMSILNVVGYNADFDGDSLNISLSLDRDIADQLENLAPHKSMFGLEAPRKVTRNASIPKPVIGTLACFVETLDEPDPIKIEKMVVLQ